MKKIITLLLCIPFLHGCAHNNTIQEKFNSLKAIDYSIFSDLSIFNRKGVLIVTYKEIRYIIKRSYITGKIVSIENDNSEEKTISLTKKDTEYIEDAIKYFDKIDVLVLFVDENKNVFLSIPWYEGCTYSFLRLSSLSTLEELGVQYYQVYEDNWYYDKECAERYR